MTFTPWAKWQDRNGMQNLKMPGVYALSITQKDIVQKPYSTVREIAYYGMTNSKGGLKSRLNQFDNTIKGKHVAHGGAQRFLFKYPDYDELCKKLYVAVRAFDCDVKSNSPKDLRVMGEIAKYEYDCFAEYLEKHGSLPEFNDKKRSPKK